MHSGEQRCSVGVAGCVFRKLSETGDVKYLGPSDDHAKYTKIQNAQIVVQCNDVSEPDVKFICSCCSWGFT